MVKRLTSQHYTSDANRCDLVAFATGKILASCSVDGAICLNVAASGELLSRFFYPANNTTSRRVNAVHFSSGSRFLASGGSDGNVRVWDLKTQEVTQTYSVSASAVTSVTFSGYKDEQIVAGSESGAISVYDVQTSEASAFLAVDPNHGVYKVTALQSSPHPYARHSIGATYGDGSVRVWDASTAQLTAEFIRQHQNAAATSLAISPVSKVLLTSGGLDGRVIFFDTLQGKNLRSMELDHPVSALALGADGKTLSVGTSTGELLIFDLRGHITPLYTTTAHEEAASVTSLHFACSGSDTSSFASVLPEGQPVVSREQVSPGKTGMTVHEIAVHKLQSLGITNDQHHPSSSPAVSPTGSSSRPQPFVSQPQPAITTSSQSKLFPPNAWLSTTNRSPVKSDDQRYSETAFPDSQISSTRERVGVPHPKNDECDHHQVQQRIQTLCLEMENHSRSQVEQINAILNDLLHRYEAVLEENDVLRTENEHLKQHLMLDR